MPAKKAEPKEEAASEGRVEVYEVTNPDGETVTVTRNIDTGEHEVSTPE
jgi:hypothetical protein